MLRQGSTVARSLLESTDISEWRNELGRYEDAVAAMAESKSKKELIDLDKWLWNDYKETVRSRVPMSITKEELVKVMKWKLLRGKNRPALLGLVGQNDGARVASVSAAAFAFIEDSKWKECMLKLQELRGVGPATASAIVAPIFETVPFMSDEALEAASGKKRDYNMRAYECMRNRLKEVEGQLEGWGAGMEGLGKALWVKAVLSYLPISSCADSAEKRVSEQDDQGSKKRRRHS